MLIQRRQFLGMLAAPAIVRAASLMPVRALKTPPRIISVLGGWLWPARLKLEGYDVIDDYFYPADDWTEINGGGIVTADQLVEMERRLDRYAYLRQADKD